MSEISKWFCGKNVFITGATGLVGKSLVEKLLRDCPDIGNIYVMIRAKKGVNSTERAKEYKNHFVFSRVKETRPQDLEKICCIDGDLLEPKLGICEFDRKLIAETASIIFHVAATVQFDKTFIEIYNSNVIGTKSVLDFGTEFKHLDVS